MEGVEFTTSLDGVEPRHLDGFFEGWPVPPSPERHLRILHGAQRVVLAREPNGGAVVGFITAISDGVASAFIPLLEVLPEWRGGGIGSELVRRMLAELQGLYAIDLACDADMVEFYRGLGAFELTAMAWRDRESLRD